MSCPACSMAPNDGKVCRFCGDTRPSADALLIAGAIRESASVDCRCDKHRMLKCIRCDIDVTERLFERWMVWASGVAFKSEEGEALVRETDAFLARSASGSAGQGQAGKVPDSESPPGTPAVPVKEDERP